MLKIKILIIVSAFLISVSGAFCEENTASEENALREPRKLSNTTGLSYVKANGNTDVESLSAKNNMIYKFNKNVESQWKFYSLYGENDGERNSEKYETSLKLSYLFKEKLYGSVICGWSKDVFAGISNNYYCGPLVGYKFFTGPKHTLLYEVGTDYVEIEYTDETEDDYFRGRLYGEYTYAFNDKNKFSQSVEYLDNFDESDDYEVVSETALTSSINDVLSIKTSYKLKYNNSPIPSDLDKKDTTLSVAIVIDY